jgi:HSP20 family protein
MRNAFMFPTLRNNWSRPLAQVWRDFDKLFNRFFGDSLVPLEEFFGETRGWNLKVAENDNEVVVRAEMPGFEEQDLDVQVARGVLTIKAEKQENSEHGQHATSYHRSLKLPEGIDAGKVQATYRNGVLELHLPRAEETKPRRIPVQGQQGPTDQAAGQ